MNNLEQIAKQVSLLNRLIELLRMQEDPTDESLEELGTFTWMPNRMAYSECRSYICAKDDVDFTFEQAWNHPITQKAWSDELVKVARELDNFEHLSCGSSNLITDIQFAITGEATHWSWKAALRFILNKYGRSLDK